MWVKQTFSEKRKTLSALLEPPLRMLAELCAEQWHSVDKLDTLLQSRFTTVPYSHLLYTMDKLAKQISSNVTAKYIDASYRGQDLSRRPFSVSLFPKRHFMLSSVYISNTTGCPCLSAVQPVVRGQQFLGFVVADFDLNRLPLADEVLLRQPRETAHSTPVAPASQMQTLAQANMGLLHPTKRITSKLDIYMDILINVLHNLMCHHGIFHCTIHYSSGQLMLWHLQQPYQYRLLSVSQLVDADNVLDYPHTGYPDNALLCPTQVRAVLERFQLLRLADDTIYLRAGSLNIMNGMVGLSFSVDGSQYMPADEFLQKAHACWLQETDSLASSPPANDVSTA